MICTHITDTTALTFRDKLIARIVAQKLFLWRGLLTVFVMGLWVGEVDQLRVKAALWRGLLTVHGAEVGGEVDQLWGDS